MVSKIDQSLLVCFPGASLIGGRFSKKQPIMFGLLHALLSEGREITKQLSQDVKNLKKT